MSKKVDTLDNYEKRAQAKVARDRAQPLENVLGRAASGEERTSFANVNDTSKARVMNLNKAAEKAFKQLVAEVEKTGEERTFVYTDAKTGKQNALLIQPAGVDPKADAVNDGMPTVNIYNINESGEKQQLTKHEVSNVLKNCLVRPVEKVAREGKKAITNTLNKIDHAIDEGIRGFGS